MDIHAVLKHLPHRYPFLLVDRVLEVGPGRRLVALKNVSINEPFFAGHFPSYPVMPGVLIIEAMAQAAALLASTVVDDPLDEDSINFLVGVDGARFKRQIVPGDQLRIEVEVLREVRGLFKFAGRTWVGEVLAAECELMCTRRRVRNG
jgi:3-hydroxyacyl-[acyl-carrier-protein] dehydratase